MKKPLFKLLTIAALATSAHGATIFGNLTAVSSNDPNDGQNFGAGGLPALTNDGFAYDIDDPVSVFPTNGGAVPTFHANGPNNVDITIDFTIDSLAVSVGDTLFVDLYGRSGFPGRDNDIIVQFLTGDVAGGMSAVVGTTGQSGIDGDLHSRAEFVITAPTANITGFRVIGGDTENASANIFTLTEARGGVIAIPEPSSAALFGLGGLALLLRRRK